LDFLFENKPSGNTVWQHSWSHCLQVRARARRWFDPCLPPPAVQFSSGTSVKPFSTLFYIYLFSAEKNHVRIAAAEKMRLIR
jgi:hypothetical protein